jgi:hypothetical protein
VSSTPATPCPRCGAAASGHFCARCGAPLGNRTCSSCGTTLAADAKFCHKCGAAPGQGANAPGTPTGPAGALANKTPWIIAAVLTLVTVAAIAYSARGTGAPETAQMANAGNAGVGTAGGAGEGQPVDISQMSLLEQYIRLMNKVTAAAENGDSATVVNFTPMALGAYTNLPDSDRDSDARYHAAMLHVNVGGFAEALALADTITATDPNNLMATHIRIIVAERQGDSAKAKAEQAKFRQHFDAEIKKPRPEYEAHTTFLENYRKGLGGN